MTAAAYVEHLTREECIARLATVNVGRLGVTIGALPAVQPVIFALVSGYIVFRVPPGSSLQRATDGQVICFEADRATATGDSWTVQVQGICHRIEPANHAKDLDALPLPHWHVSPQGHDCFLTIPLDRVTGQRMVWNSDG